MSTFSGLNTAQTALWAQQRAMDVTGQNVANVNTEGYSRQRVDLQSVGGAVTPAFWSRSSQVGQGVDADHVARIRDAFLEARARSEHATAASLTAQDSALTQVQQAFREPGDTGIQSMLSKLWAGWGDIANNPTDPGARAQLLERAQTLVAGMHTTGQALDGQWTQNHVGLQTLLTDVNATAASIADLNQAIRRATQSGLPTNELADKRDTLVLRLSEQVGATATPMADGTLNIVVSGTTIVHDDAALQLKLTGANDLTTVSTDPPTVVTVPGGTALRPGGTAGGQLTAMTSIIPRYRDQLDAIAGQLATQVNTVHATGYDLYGNPGEPMFDNGGAGTAPITAASISLRITDTKKLAAAKLGPADTGGKISSDNGSADTLFQQRLDSAGADATYRKMIVALGVEAATTSGNLDTQNVISSQVDASRESVSGVNLDEEMSNMIQFQHAYSAAGQLVSAINDMLDTVITMVGR